MRIGGLLFHNFVISHTHTHTHTHTENLSVIQLQVPRILVNGLSAFIRWSLPDIAGMTPVNTTVSYRAENRNALYTYTSSNSITLTGLLPATFYNVFVTPVFNLGGGRTATGTVSMVDLTTRKIGIYCVCVCVCVDQSMFSIVAYKYCNYTCDI